MNNTPQIETERQKQVNEWLNELHGAAQRSYDTCGQLRERLNPLMRREPAEAPMTEVPEVELVDVAQAIRIAVKLIDAISENHREMLQLLEV